MFPTNCFSPLGCKLEAGKEIVFNPEDDDFEHQLDLRMACIDTTTKDELHVVEVEGQDEEGQKVLAVLASLKPSTLPSVSRPRPESYVMPAWLVANSPPLSGPPSAS
ncbi:hypothetical protein NHX12_010134 [Muraenolepis orangiensis]|uniref:Nucleoplasmin core domain-containing protein n=1 Tax=Muraenolepis orangiensis TaxID=630683 RepID=A0A9Q0DIZ8_9TELE|nr:hypothetical protein NHX12_010134 [Muraenolepis orangiensis]